uniref:Ig-like domain-containing protein n=1 Tax=Chelydra serpentina TaxID=8475 RepID=A0A8C3SAZ3_CHESE
PPPPPPTCRAVISQLAAPQRTYGNSVTQTEGTITVPEGKPVLLNCTYKTSGSPVTFWYVQYPHEAPRLLLAEYEATDEEERKRRRGFSAKHERNPIAFHLNKNSSEVSDSAVYYCALSDTVTETQGGLTVGILRCLTLAERLTLYYLKG